VEFYYYFVIIIIIIIIGKIVFLQQNGKKYSLFLEIKRKKRFIFPFEFDICAFQSTNHSIIWSWDLQNGIIQCLT
jgi:hypothetical protein